MSVITKKIGKNKYAYFAVREGKRVIHKYLGSINDPRIARIIAYKKETTTIPERFHSLFWDTDPGKIHIKKNARYIIERVLEFGDMDAIEWLHKVYSVYTIIDVLYLSKTITEKTRNFWLIWFGLTNDA